MTNYSLISTKHMINCVTKKKHFYTLKILLVHDKHGCNLTACKLYEQTFSRICMILDQILNCSFASSVAMAISSHLSTAWINNKLSQILWPTTKHLSIWLPSWIFKPWSIWTNLLYPVSLLKIQILLLLKYTTLTHPKIKLFFSFFIDVCSALQIARKRSIHSPCLETVVFMIALYVTNTKTKQQ